MRAPVFLGLSTKTRFVPVLSLMIYRENSRKSQFLHGMSSYSVIRLNLSVRQRVAKTTLMLMNTWAYSLVFKFFL
jgi:hypothetical protein